MKHTLLIAALVKHTLLIAVLVTSCTPKEYTVTCTKPHLFKPDEIRVFDRAIHVSKHGWLTSDRYTIRTAGGSTTVLHGKWHIEVTPNE